jgi:hypothetical protein
MECKWYEKNWNSDKNTKIIALIAVLQLIVTIGDVVAAIVSLWWLDLHLNMQSVSITAKFVSLNSICDEVT